IHLGQFRQKNSRNPNPEELLDIMLSKMKLPGIADDEKDDQFEIVDLARSIAVNGIRKPPILDIDGTPLDGNRRFAACYYIRNSDEFDSEQKRRAEYIQVWQLTEHATDDDRNAVVVSLNFESDCKLDWPEYIKARKVYEEWQAMLALEPRANSRRQAQMKRELSIKFALGPETHTITKYLNMVEWASDFEDYHINDKNRGAYEVQHRADKYFQYFNELYRGGTTPGGVAFALNQDEGLKHTVFDLIYDGKLRNPQQIRALKPTFYNQEARELLARARNESDLDLANDHVEDAINIARSQRAEMRELGANSRIESFVKWLEEVPPRAFRDQITSDNLQGLVRALKLVEPMVVDILQEKSIEV
ncbi:MAG: ParB N-terminal domain-containing protein, partial [Nostoc sp.]